MLEEIIKKLTECGLVSSAVWEQVGFEKAKMDLNVGRDYEETCGNVSFLAEKSGIVGRLPRI
jgi:hypothetical protein